MVSSGSIIDGTVINSIIGRDCVIKKGAVIKNSFVMSGCFVEENAHLDYAIIDKQSVIKTGTVKTGSLKEPFVTQKEQLVTNVKSMRILLVASESYPFIKTGGLADVIGSLSRNLARLSMDVTVMIPLYINLKNKFRESLKREDSFKVEYNAQKVHCRTYSYKYKKVKHVFIESHDYFDRDEVYGYDDDTDRFALFNKAVITLLDNYEPFDIIHIHDWHTALIPLLLEHSKHKEVKTLLSLHNVAYQGIGSTDIFRKLGIPYQQYKSHQINFLETGINTATKLATVSPTYKEELKYEYYGKNLTGSLLKRERDFYGILNGISSTWNPSKDPLIYTNYNVNTIELKALNKRYLQETMGLNISENTFVMGMVTRIVEQKGFDLILESFDDLCYHYDVQFILLGSGDEYYIKKLRELENRHPNKIKLNIGYDATVPNYIYAGADVFLMPSRFEPCGLGQMIALKYGTIPIVRDTGGLADTVVNFDELTHKGNGFKFFNYDSNELKNHIKRAYHVFAYNKPIWRKLQERAMRADYSLKKSANKYIELYRAIIEK
jgi:starch synthase